MTVEEFASRYGIKPDTVMRRIDEIPGHIKGEKGITFIPGTRYPTDKRYKTEEKADRVYAVLKATSKNRYIDHVYLGIEESSFDHMLAELSAEGLIAENGTDNPYGANRYDLTMEGSELIKKDKRAVCKLIAELLGTFVGNMISNMTPR